MSLLNTLELKFGHLAIPGLIRAVVGLNLVVWVAYKLDRNVLDLLVLDRALIMQGQVWRLVTYIFIPAIGGQLLEYLWLFLYLAFLWTIGEGLEHAWGSFKLNLFYLLGMLGTTTATFCFGSGDSTGEMLNLSLLFAFATLFPDFLIRLFFILPIRIKWLAWASLAWLGLIFLKGDWSVRSAIVAALSNYLLFFWQPIWELFRENQKISARRREYQRKAAPDGNSLHECAVCHRTESSDPDLDFRVSKDGEEYCTEHLPSRA